MDFRSEVKNDELTRLIMVDYRLAMLDAPTRAVLDFAVKLTHTPSEMRSADVDGLRGHGFDDRAITDIVQITGYFNYINRVADGLGVDLEEGMPPKAG